MPKIVDGREGEGWATVGINFRPADRDRIIAAAAREDRPLASFCRRIILDYLDRIEAEDAQAH